MSITETVPAEMRRKARSHQVTFDEGWPHCQSVVRPVRADVAAAD